MSKKIGFIGIGLMGLPMAKNILKSGYTLKAFNRSQNKAEPLKEFGAEISTSIDDVVKDSDVVITMLRMMEQLMM
jgi:2-hydroxy-3-oxopropionate reductase